MGLRAKCAKIIAEPLFAWLFLAIEVAVAVYLLIAGDGRVTAYQDGECVEGEGAPWVAVAIFSRAEVALGAQFVFGTTVSNFATGFRDLESRVELLDRTKRRGSFYEDEWCSRGFAWAVPFSVYSLLPALVNASAVCLIWDNYPLLTLFGIMALVISCCCCIPVGNYADIIRAKRLARFLDVGNWYIQHMGERCTVGVAWGKFHCPPDV